MENEYFNRKKQLLVQIQQELNFRSNAWETICKMPEFKTYVDLRKSLNANIKRFAEQKVIMDALQKEYDKIPEIEGSRISLWFKLLKTKIKYRRSKKYKAVLRIDQAQYNYDTKKLKHKLKMGKLYEAKNNYEVTRIIINEIQNNEIYSYIEGMRQNIKNGEDFDRVAMDIAIYGKKPFDVKKYSYKALTEYKEKLNHEITRDEKIYE